MRYFIQQADPNKTHKSSRNSVSGTISTCNKNSVRQLISPVKITTYYVTGFIEQEVFIDIFFQDFFRSQKALLNAFSIINAIGNIFIFNSNFTVGLFDLFIFFFNDMALFHNFCVGYPYLYIRIYPT